MSTKNKMYCKQLELVLLIALVTVGNQVEGAPLTPSPTASPATEAPTCHMKMMKKMKKMKTKKKKGNLGSVYRPPTKPACGIADNTPSYAAEQFGLKKTNLNDWKTCWVFHTDTNPTCADLEGCERIMIYNEPIKQQGKTGKDVAKAWKNYVTSHNECFKGPRHVVGPAVAGGEEQILKFYKDFFKECRECDVPTSNKYITDLAFHAYGAVQPGNTASREQIKGNMEYTHGVSCALQQANKDQANKDRTVLLTEFGGFLNTEDVTWPDGHWSDAIEFIYDPTVPTCIEQAFYFAAKADDAVGNRLFEDDHTLTSVGKKFADYCPLALG